MRRLMASSQVSDWHNNYYGLDPKTPGISFPSRSGPAYTRDGLICQLSAREYLGVYANNDILPATLEDLSTANNDATRVVSPLFKTNITPNGGPCFHGTSSGGYFTLPAGMWTGKTAGHLFGYVNSPTTAGGQESGPWYFRNGGTAYGFYPYSDEKIYDGSLTGSRQIITPTMTVRQKWRVYEVSSNGTQTIKLDGTTQYSASHAFVAPASGNELIRGGWASTGTIQMAEFLAYDRVLTATEAQLVRAYLVEKYGATG